MIQINFKGDPTLGNWPYLIFLRPARFFPPVSPLFEGHVPDDVAAVSAAEDEEARHEEVPDEEHGPRVRPETVQEVVRHRVKFVLKF
jgi:hypothetical protein